MPFLGEQPTYDVSNRVAAGGASLSDSAAASSSVAGSYFSPVTTLAGDIGFAPLDLLDTVASSASFGAIKRGSVNQQALNAIDSPGLNQFYEQNKGGIEAASGIAGVVASELIAKRFLGSDSAFMAGVSKLPYVRRIAALDDAYATSMATVRNVDRQLASQGAMGVEQYVGRVATNDAINSTLAAADTVTRNAAVRAAKWTGFAVGARNAALTEGVMAVTLNQNGFLYDDSYATNLAFGAAGLAIGGGAEAFHAAYSIRKFVNSDEIRRTFANAMDPGSVEDKRLILKGLADKDKVDETLPGDFLGGSITDRVTSLLVNATKLKETPTDLTDAGKALLTNRESLATQQRQLAQEEINKVTSKGISSQGKTRFGMTSPGYGNHINMMLYRDAGSAYGLEQIGGLTDEMTFAGLHGSHMNRLDERLAESRSKIDELADTDPVATEQLQGLVKRLNYEKTLTPLAVVDGQYMSLAEGTAFEGFTAPDIKFTGAELRGKGQSPVLGLGAKGDRHGLWETVTENPKGGLSLDSDFLWHIPGAKSLDKADLYDAMRLYKLGDRAAEQMAKFSGPLTLPKKPDWFQLDMAEEVLRRNKDAKVVFPDGMNRETAQTESLLQKSKGLAKWDATESIKMGKQGEDYESQMSRLRVRYNLPRLSSYEQALTGQTDHPVMSLLRGLDSYGGDDIKNMSLMDLQTAAAQFKRIGDVSPTTANDMDLFGNSFRMGVDESGKPIKPLLAYKRSLAPDQWTTDTVAERLAASKLNTMDKLTGQEAAPLTRNTAASVITSPDYELASRTHELMDNQIQGNLTGSAPQSFWGGLRNSVATSEWRDRDSPIMLAASRVRESVNRTVRDGMKVTFERAFGDSLGQLENPRNAGSALLLDQFHSFASGWDIADKPLTRPDGYAAFGLADTEANRERFKLMFDREMVKGQALLSPSGKEVTLDELGLAAQQQFNQVTDSLAAEKNTLLRAQGRGQIDTRSWYTPPPSTNGKFVGFTIGPDGKTVPGMTVVEATPEAFAKSQRAMEARVNDLGIGYAFRTQDQINQFSTIWDRAQMDFMDPGTTAIQPNKTARGALTGQEIRVGAWKESLQTIRDQYLAHGEDLVETMFKDSINSAKARANIATDVTANKGRLQENRSIYDMYLENLLGSSKLKSEKSMVGRLYNPFEGTIDGFLAASTPSVSRVWTATNAWINKLKPWDSGQQARKDFDALTEKLGPHMPFESAVQMLERQGAGATPATLAKITGSVNKFSAAILLRMFEVAHPIMNLSGIINAMPSVIRHVMPQGGEAIEDYAARVGHSATIFDMGPDKGPLGVIDMSKLGARAFKRAWSKESEADYDYMVRNGFLTQEVAEFHRQFGAIESPGSWSTFFYGDPNKTGFSRKGLVGWTDVASSRSEDFSRSWGHMVGLELADELGITGREATNNFAHDIANKMIANYSPQNRPEIFSGAVGANIGLFQSFMQNYYQRIFRYVETKDYQSLAYQYAMQASLYGVTGVPGWQAFQAAWSHLSSGKTDPNSAINERFGGGSGDLLGGGVISNIPKLFGLPSVDLYSRADTSIRQFGVNLNQSPTQVASSLIPAFSVLTKVGQGIGAGLAAFHIDNPSLSAAQLSEVASNMIANRPLAGMIEQFLNGGKDTDQYGQLVMDTKSWAESAYRLIGLRSQRQSQELNAFYANKNQQEIQAAKQSEVRLATRAAIRTGQLDKALPDIFQQYVENGGDPKYFRRWIKANYKSAAETRGESQLESLQKTLTDPSKMGQAVRLVDAGVTIDQDENVKDPNLGYGPQLGDELNQDTVSGMGQYDGQITTDQQ